MFRSSPQRATSPGEIEPLWPEAPRLCPDQPLPAYRFVPGLNPHPVLDPHGHSHGGHEAPGTLPPAERWRECDDYLYGIDLYHQGYLWESHEVWEGLWRQANREDAQALFLQGLIQNSAAQLKAHLGSLRGIQSLSRNAYAHIEEVMDSLGGRASNEFMGLDLIDLLAQMETHYRPVWVAQDDVMRLEGHAPRLRVADRDS